MGVATESELASPPLWAEELPSQPGRARIRARKKFGDLFKSILKEGINAGEFPQQDPDTTAACIVGAYTEALVGPIGPSRTGVKDRERLIRSISEFCVRAVSLPAVAVTRRKAAV